MSRARRPALVSNALAAGIGSLIPGADLRAVEQEAQREALVKFAGYIPPEVANATRDAVHALGRDWTIGDVMAAALSAEIERLAQEHHGGAPFPARTRSRLRTGARLG